MLLDLKLQSFKSESTTGTPFHVFKAHSNRWMVRLTQGTKLTFVSRILNTRVSLDCGRICVRPITDDWRLVGMKEFKAWPENSFVDVFSMISSTLMFSLLSPNLCVHEDMNVRISVLSYKIYVESTNLRRFGTVGAECCQIRVCSTWNVYVHPCQKSSRWQTRCDFTKQMKSRLRSIGCGFNRDSMIPSHPSHEKRNVEQ